MSPSSFWHRFSNEFNSAPLNGRPATLHSFTIYTRQHTRHRLLFFYRETLCSAVICCVCLYVSVFEFVKSRYSIAASAGEYYFLLCITALNEWLPITVRQYAVLNSLQTGRLPRQSPAECRVRNEIFEVFHHQIFRGRETFSKVGSKAWPHANPVC